MFTLGFITPTTGIIVLTIVLIIFGPGKLPEIGRSLGSGIRAFKDSTNPSIDESAKQVDDK